MIYLKLCDEKTNSIRTNNKEIGGICRPFEIIPTYSNAYSGAKSNAFYLKLFCNLLARFICNNEVIKNATLSSQN